MQLGQAKWEPEYHSDLTGPHRGKKWTYQRTKEINFANKQARWIEDRLQSIYHLSLPRLPPLVGDECWRKWLSDKEVKHTNTEGEDKRHDKRCMLSTYRQNLSAKSKSSSILIHPPPLAAWFLFYFVVLETLVSSRTVVHLEKMRKMQISGNDNRKPHHSCKFRLNRHRARCVIHCAES